VSIEQLPLLMIFADPAAQPRAGGLDDRHVEDLRAAYERGDEVPRVTVWKIGSVYKISEGFHRLEAAVRAGLKRLEVECHVGSELEWKIDAFTSNTDHGLKRTPDDIRRAVEQLTALCPDWSDRRLAERLAISPSTVAKYRTDVSSLDTSPTDRPTRLDTLGRRQPATKTKGSASPDVPIGLFDPAPFLDLMLPAWARRLRSATTAELAASELEQIAHDLRDQAERLRGSRPTN
jgi:hypothetical protein